jgi:hypothetical protein
METLLERCSWRRSKQGAEATAVTSRLQRSIQVACQLHHQLHVLYCLSFRPASVLSYERACLPGCTRQSAKTNCGARAAAASHSGALGKQVDCGIEYAVPTGKITMAEYHDRSTR